MATTEVMTQEEEQMLEISGELLQALDQYKEKLIELDQDMKDKALSIGKILTDVNGLLSRENLFKNWIENNLGWSSSTAYNYMTVYRKFGYLQLEGGLDALPIPQSGLYMLASDKVSEKTRQEILERAKRGEAFSTRGLKTELKRLEHPQQKEQGSKAEPTFCLWCEKKDLPISPMRNTRKGICATCAADALRFIADIQASGLVPQEAQGDE